MNEYIEYYMDFINGTLDFESEQKFTELFANDTVFRSGFKSYLTISQTISSNINSFEPSINQSNNIFKELGMKNLITKTTNENGLKQSFYKSKLFTVIITALITTLLLSSFFFLVKDNLNANNQLKHSLTVKDSSTPQSFKNFSNLKNNIITEDNLGNSRQNFQKKNNNEMTRIKNDDVGEEIRTDQQFVELSYSAFSPITSDNIEEEVGFTELIFNVDSLHLFDNYLEEQSEKIRIESKHFLNWNIPHETIYPFETSKFNNLGLSILYPINKNFSIGAEIRQETFFVQYSGIKETAFFKYEQQPNLTGYNLLIRY